MKIPMKPQTPKITDLPPDTLSTGHLFLVGTPIGHLQDITLRALDTLKGVTCIGCEDTRVTSVLTAAYGITTPLFSYNDHNGAQKRPQLMARLTQGESLALVSDAGMPLISDPGYKLVVACKQACIPITVIPGPSAVLTALCGAALATDRFIFHGFLPSKPLARRTVLEDLQSLTATMVFFEAPHRILETLQAILEVWGDRQAALCRELTKKFEETRHLPLSQLIESCIHTPPRGEITLVVEGACDDRTTHTTDHALETIFQSMLPIHSLKDAVTLLAEATGLPRRTVYQKALSWQKNLA